MLRSHMTNVLLIIDPQNDFCIPNGSLYVPHAEDDCKKTSEFITKNSTKINAIHVTLDCHPMHHIAHPIFWLTEDGNIPKPFGEITLDNFIKEKFKPKNPNLIQKVETYLQELESKGRYNLTLWPPHCLIGTTGFCVEETINTAIADWEIKNYKNANYTVKSPNPYTEHYSAIQAEVPDPEDVNTRTNFALIDKLKKADRLIITGEALSHCVANTLRDVAIYLPPSKMVLLNDCTSPVAGFEHLGNKFVEEFVARGMKSIKSTDLTL